MPETRISIEVPGICNSVLSRETRFNSFIWVSIESNLLVQNRALWKSVVLFHASEPWYKFDFFHQNLNQEYHTIRRELHPWKTYPGSWFSLLIVWGFRNGLFYMNYPELQTLLFSQFLQAWCLPSRSQSKAEILNRILLWKSRSFCSVVQSCVSAKIPKPVVYFDLSPNWNSSENVSTSSISFTKVCIENFKLLVLDLFAISVTLSLASEFC